MRLFEFMKKIKVYIEGSMDYGERRAENYFATMEAAFDNGFQW
jgi:hypothetical protein